MGSIATHRRARLRYKLPVAVRACSTETQPGRAEGHSCAGLLDDQIQAPCRSLVEICCDKDSLLSELAPDFNIKATRITVEHRFDLKEGLNYTRDVIAGLDGPDAWAALPCTPWCTWTYLNEALLGAEYVARLAWRRRQSLKMVKHTEICFALAFDAGGCLHFEWPRHCRGWQRPQLKALLRRFPFLLALFDGCRFNVRGQGGELALKPWRLATTRIRLFAALDGVLCRRDHVHDPLRGTAATRSGHYTRELCEVVIAALVFDSNSNEGSAGAVEVSEIAELSSRNCAGKELAEDHQPSGVDSVVALFDSWIDVLMESRTSFALYLAAFIKQEVPFQAGRCRDALPLPLITTADLDWPASLSKERISCFTKLVVNCGAALNFLFGSNIHVAVPRRATELHLDVYRRLSRKLLVCVEGLDSLKNLDEALVSFSQLVGRGSSDSFPKLQADAVDLLPACGKLNSMDCIPPELQKVVASPNLLFPQGVKHLRRRCAFEAGERVEYLKFLRRQLLAGKVALALRVHVADKTFAINKKMAGCQREIWHGGRLTAAAVPPPKPPRLANPAALVHLESSVDRPLWMSGRDGHVFFDQLGLPDTLRPYMGRPFVQVAELLVGSGLGLSCLDVGGFSESDLNSFIIDGKLDSSIVELTPVNCTWAMGFGWSSYISQSYMLTCCEEAGFNMDQCLSEEGVLPPVGTDVLSVATDDILHFRRCAKSELDALTKPPLEPLDRVWVNRGVLGSDSKSFDLQASGTALGVELHNGTWLRPRSFRLCELFSAARDLLVNPHATPLELASYGGMLQWFDLLDRPLLACLHEFYHFTESGEGDRMLVVVPLSVLSELTLNLCLFPLWTVDLARPWLPCLPASDASPCFGFGFCLASCRPELSRQVASHVAAGPHCIRPTWCEGDPIEVSREGVELRLPLTIADFKPVLSVRAKQLQHSGGLEASGVVLSLRRLARRRRWHSHRGVFLVDAQVVQHALNKGRSSAGTLRFQCMQVAALTLACDWKWFYGYVPSESHAPDWPSRGKQYIRAKRSSTGLAHPCRLSKKLRLDRSLFRALRRRPSQQWTPLTSLGSGSLAAQCL